MNICSLSLHFISNLKFIVMPGKDKTGPQGAGSMTGRRMGYCADNENQQSGFFGRGGRMGIGNRRGSGFGMHGGRNSAFLAENDKSSLENEIGDLKSQLASLAKEVLGLKAKDIN